MGMFLRRGPAPHRTRMSDLEIGQTIKLNLNGAPWEWLVVHQGLPSDIYDASCDGTWLLLKDIYEKLQWNSSDVNKLESSTIHSYLNGDFQNRFDSNIKDAIKQVKIPYRKNGGSNGTDQSGANGLLTKSFLLSWSEVGFATSDIQNSSPDGAKLDYFVASTAGNSTRIANFNGSADDWWLRSQSTGGTRYVFGVYSDGDYFSDRASVSNGIRPAIILTSDMLVTDDMLTA